nr:serine/threonine protein phosphatase [uncultured bacterium]BAH90546.1 serine/threonine protein phosphatase [uncultured bacterium]
MDIVAESDVGRVRRNNEDALAYDADRGIAVLADGMGGLDAGEVASRIAVESIMGMLGSGLDRRVADLESLILRAVQAANADVCARGRASRVDMGTTVVAWLLTAEGQCFIAHVGDSRAYRLRGSELRRLTTDHSMVQQMIDEGLLGEAEAQTAPNRNVITRALGLNLKLEVDVRSWVHRPGDLYLLCSDGLTDLVSEDEIGALLESHAGVLTEAATRLVNRANDAGGHDNVSVLLIRP